jgi:hypothetical protein
MIKWENKIFELEEDEDDDLGEWEEENAARQMETMDGGVNKAVNLSVGGCKMALPEGSRSRSLPLCEEIYIPPPVQSNKQFLASYPRVKVDTLDEVEIILIHVEIKHLNIDSWANAFLKVLSH